MLASAGAHVGGASMKRTCPTASLDLRHFGILRPRHVAGLQLLLDTI
jgi:hypothetical protein